MSGKICGECGESFAPSRSSQRFCSTRCANTQRDRRRRHLVSALRPNPATTVQLRDTVAESGPVVAHCRSRAKLAAALAGSVQRQEFLRNQLRAQAADIDRLEAENAEQRDVIRNLRADLARLQTIQQTDAHDLVHLAGRLLALTQATDVELHSSTKALFRRRGWTAAKRNPESQKP